MNRRSFSRVLLPLMAPVAVVGASFAPPARAEDTIMIQLCDTLFTLKEHDRLGLSGKGIAIALIDGPVDTFAPELQGANVTTVAPCPCAPIPDSISHGTAITSLPASPDYGIAPGATILHYAIPLGNEGSTQEDPGCSTDLGLVLARALNDDANIISYPIIGSSTITLHDGLIQAGLGGTIVVVSMDGNNQEDDTRSLASASLTVGVAVINIQGERRDYSNYGKGTAISLYADPASARDYATGQINHETAGTSVTTVLTSGYLALAMERWPETTNRQILQPLVRTASHNDGVKQDRWYGYEITSYIALLIEDPRGRPNEDLLLRKNDDQAPNEDLYNDYIDGLLDPGDEVITDPNYIYRGTNSNLVSVTPQNTAYDTPPQYR